MDSHSFRCAGQELVRLLSGARVEKIHEPLPGVLVFTVFAAGEKRRLTLRADRARPLLLFVDEVPPNPARPSAGVMRLRKYVSGRRLGAGRMDFVRRRLAFALPEPKEPEEDGKSAGVFFRYLLLDMREGAFVLASLPADFAEAPLWPEGSALDGLCAAPGGVPPDWKKESVGPWTAYPVLTPLLRETLAELDAPEGRALLVDLEAGGGDLFLYAGKDGVPAFYSAWPLPEALLVRRALTPVGQPLPSGDFAGRFPCLHAVSLVDKPAFHAAAGREFAREENLAGKRERKRLARLLEKLTREEERLLSLTALKAEALLLQENLWRYPAGAKFAEAALPERTVKLDPLLTVRDNMTRMFRQAARGERGLGMLAARKAEVAADLARLEADSARTAAPGAEKSDPGSRRAGAGRGAAAPAGTAASSPGVSVEGFPGPSEAVASGIPAASGDCCPGGLSTAGDFPAGATGIRALAEEDSRREGKDVARFRSSDGFVILRGKNARGNQALLKLGQPYDYWLHAEDGPSAHAVIRRAHAAEEVPERTLLEAGFLVGQKSRYRDDARARLMLALLRHVHPVKGAAPGTVRVDVVRRVFAVPMDMS